jgi:hypothetical protein
VTEDRARPAATTPAEEAAVKPLLRSRFGRAVEIAAMETAGSGRDPLEAIGDLTWATLIGTEPENEVAPGWLRWNDGTRDAYLPDEVVFPAPSADAGSVLPHDDTPAPAPEPGLAAPLQSSSSPVAPQQHRAAPPSSEPASDTGRADPPNVAARDAAPSVTATASARTSSLEPEEVSAIAEVSRSYCSTALYALCSRCDGTIARQFIGTGRALGRVGARAPIAYAQIRHRCRRAR